MKIVLYGISRSGKSSFIKRLCNNNKKIKHLTGSKTLYKLAKNKYGIDFEQLNDDKKVILRSKLINEFALESKKHPNIIVDGHYSFPNKEYNDFDIVMKDDDLQFYDLFLYMYKPSNLILKNTIEVNKEQWTDFLKLEDNINLWQYFEIESLRKRLKSIGKELVVLNEDLSVCEQYISDVIEGVIKTSEVIVDEAVKEILLNDNLQEIFLLDCDKTLSINDITNFVIKEKNIENKIVIDNFKENFYTQYQSYRFHKHILNNNIKPYVKEGVQKIELNYNLINNIKNTNVQTVGLTLGLADIWSEVNKVNNIFTISPCLVGKKDDNNIYMSYFTKYLIGKKLKEKGIKVYSIGDSIADMMLLEEADKSWVVINNKLSSTAKKYFIENPNSKIYQISYSNEKYDNLKVEDKICLK